ncbi:MAG: 23S rRNA (uracil(1939)-C(5))-methyltransferase RlmD [Saprospiraceae bacterium]
MGRKRKKITLEKVAFHGIADRGKGVGRTSEGQVVFADKAVPGDVADVLVSKKRKGYFMGKVTRFHEYSTDRREPFCQHFGVCGGCKWQGLDYAAQLRHKDQVVKDALQRIGKVDVGAFLPIIGAEETQFYRNKLEFSFSNKKWLPFDQLNSEISNREDVLGFHPAGAFDKIIDIEKCWLQPEPSNEIRNTIREIAKEQGLSFYDNRAHEGFMRTLMLRITSLGEVLLVVAFGEADQEKQHQFLDTVVERLPFIDALYYCTNTKLNDFMMDLPMEVYKGKDHIEERLGDVRFKIYPKSFFQTNTSQAKTLYDVVVEFAELQGTENVYDLYTGLGSIALYVAKYSKQVVGIEELPDAIKGAKENAQLNGIDNSVFYAGDVKDILTDEFAEKHGLPDLLITDPPRAGMHPDVVKMLLKLAAPRLVYVSCNPATQARDVQLLSEKYVVEKVRPVDMFPHTHHIESVALLRLRTS